MIEHSGSSGGYAWTTGPSGECNAPCGGGTKQREIFCSAKVSLHMHTERLHQFAKLLPRTLLSAWMRVYATHTTDQKRRSLAMKILAGQGKIPWRKGGYLNVGLSGGWWAAGATARRTTPPTAPPSSSGTSSANRFLPIMCPVW